MPIHEKNSNEWFERLNLKPRARRRVSGKKAEEPLQGVKKPLSYRIVLPRMVGEPGFISDYTTTSHITRMARRRKRAPTPAERELDRILAELNGGVLKGRYKREHVISGKWIVDFWFSEIRLAIEVDGSIHNEEYQKRRDKLKDADCARFDITVVRISNREVFSDRERLINKIRDAWRQAKRRKNKIIGQRSAIPPPRKY